MKSTKSTKSSIQVFKYRVYKLVITYLFNVKSRDPFGSKNSLIPLSSELGAGTADCDLKMPLESAQLRIYYLLYIVSAMFRHKFANSRLQMHHNILPQSPRSELNCECFNNPRTQQREKTFHIFLEIFGKRKHYS